MLIGDRTTTLLERALDVNWLRQQMIANNIANVDTPGYQRQDLDFRKTLARILDTSSGEVSLVTTSDGHLQSEDSAGAGPVLLDRNPSSLRNDGNNVDIEYEMMQQVANLIQYNTLARLESDELAMLRTAITEGRS